MADDLGFEQMKRDLVARGLLDETGRLTPLGNAFTVGLIEELKTAQAPEDPDAPRVFWNIDFRRKAMERIGG